MRIGSIPVLELVVDLLLVDLEPRYVAVLEVDIFPLLFVLEL